MAEYIDRKKLIQKIRRMPRTVNPDLVQYSLVKAIISFEKSSDVAPVVHGKWYFAEDSVFRCSVCGRICHEDDAPYCYCGAKMGGGKHEAD